MILHLIQPLDGTNKLEKRIALPLHGDVVVCQKSFPGVSDVVVGSPNASPQQAVGVDPVQHAIPFRCCNVTEQPILWILALLVEAWELRVRRVEVCLCRHGHDSMAAKVAGSEAASGGTRSAAGEL